MQEGDKKSTNPESKMMRKCQLPKFMKKKNYTRAFSLN